MKKLISLKKFNNESIKKQSLPSGVARVASSSKKNYGQLNERVRRAAAAYSWAKILLFLLSIAYLSHTWTSTYLDTYWLYKLQHWATISLYFVLCFINLKGHYSTS